MPLVAPESERQLAADEVSPLHSLRPPKNAKSPASGHSLSGTGARGFKRRKAVMMTTFLKKTLASAYFPTQEYAVSWAMKSLTAEFGMGSGIPSSLWTPRKFSKCIIDRDERG